MGEEKAVVERLVQFGDAVLQDKVPPAWVWYPGRVNAADARLFTKESWLKRSKRHALVMVHSGDGELATAAATASEPNESEEARLARLLPALTAAAGDWKGHGMAQSLGVYQVLATDPRYDPAAFPGKASVKRGTSLYLVTKGRWGAPRRFPHQKGEPWDAGKVMRWTMGKLTGLVPPREAQKMNTFLKQKQQKTEL